MPKQIPNGYEPCSVTIRRSGDERAVQVAGYVSETALVIEEQNGFEIDDSFSDDDPRAHDCDWMGCGQVHVMLRIDLTYLSNSGTTTEARRSSPG